MGKKNTAPRLGNMSSGVSSFLASLVCILVGLIVGFIVLLVLGSVTLAQSGTAFNFGELMKTTWEQGFKPIVQGGFYGKANAMGMAVRMEILQAAPLIMTGLSVAFAFKTGLFNIGAAGQYTMGAFFALYSALVLHLPWYLCLVASVIGGALWGAIPGIFKAFLNVNEVITSIMFNWISLYAVNTMIYQNGYGPMFNLKTTKTFTLKEAAPDALLPTFNFNVGDKPYFGKMFQPSIGIFLAIAVAVIIWIIINKTTFGYELKACGHNKDAAKYAGINEKKNIVLSMTIAGALAGFGAGIFYLSGSKEWEPLVSTMLPATGFNGISVALLASSNPIGCIFSAIFISHITVGGGFMYAKLFPSEVADIISGVVIYLCAFSLLFKSRILKMMSSKKKNELKTIDSKTDDGKGADS